MPTPKLNAEESDLFMADLIENEDKKVRLDIEARARAVEEKLSYGETRREE